MSIEPDIKDWTWVLERPCPECGLVAAAVSPETVPDLVRDSVPRWVGALDRAEATVRPDPTTWSVLEYACHVRDVFALFTERIELVLERDDPEFANWDQDATAVEAGYDQQDPRLVGAELTRAARAAALAFERSQGSAWERPARRSNGSTFTARTLAQYFWHDVFHHLHDVRA